MDGQISVAHLVTMGSQLGMNEVLRALDGSHTSIPVKVPISIQRWTNLVAKGDLLALRQSGFFDATDPQRKPADTEVDNGNQHPHDAASYLQQRLAARTIAPVRILSFSNQSTDERPKLGAEAVVGWSVRGDAKVKLFEVAGETLTEVPLHDGAEYRWTMKEDSSFELRASDEHGNSDRRRLTVEVGR